MPQFAMFAFGCQVRPGMTFLAIRVLLFLHLTRLPCSLFSSPFFPKALGLVFFRRQEPSDPLEIHSLSPAFPAGQLGTSLGPSRPRGNPSGWNQLSRDASNKRKGGTSMAYVTVGKENSSDIQLYYEDHGSGDPVVLIHGYPLSGASWEKQIPVLLASGRRVIAYDRRGFGKSSQPTTGYNYDTFAEDLHQLVTQLKLQKFALVGFSMGGGEVARYMGKYGSKDVSKTVIIGGVPPFLLKTSDNQEGVDGSVFEGIQKAVAADRYAFFTEFFKNFYNTDLLLGKRISEQAVQASWNVAAGASATASLACVPTWHEDFRKDVAKIDVPTLVIHGDADRIVPIAAAGQRTAKLIKGARLKTVKDGPHCITWTHADEVNSELVNFLGSTQRTTLQSE